MKMIIALIVLSTLAIQPAQAEKIILKVWYTGGDEVVKAGNVRIRNVERTQAGFSSNKLPMNRTLFAEYDVEDDDNYSEVEIGLWIAGAECGYGPDVLCIHARENVECDIEDGIEECDDREGGTNIVAWFRVLNGVFEQMEIPGAITGFETPSQSELKIRGRIK